MEDIKFMLIGTKHVWGVIEHPTFGRVPRVVTIKDLKAGQELSCHYMMDMGECFDSVSTHCRWYVDLWDEFSKVKSGDKKDVQEIDEVMDMADDNNSNDQNT